MLIIYLSILPHWIIYQVVKFDQPEHKTHELCPLFGCLCCQEFPGLLQTLPCWNQEQPEMARLTQQTPVKIRTKSVKSENT